METGADCGFTGTGDLQNARPDLHINANGSVYLTQGSAGIDAVPLSLCPAADQNGSPRPDPDTPAGTTCDMGAVEWDYPPVAVSSSVNPSGYGQPVTFTATVTPTDGGGTVAFYDNSTTTIPGCGAQPLAQASGSTYTATCTTSALTLGMRDASDTHARR